MLKNLPVLHRRWICLGTFTKAPKDKIATEFQRWALGSRIVNCNMTVSLLKEARYGNLLAAVPQRDPSLAWRIHWVRSSDGCQSFRITHLFSYMPVSLSEAMIVGGMSVLEEIFFENFVYL